MNKYTKYDEYTYQDVDNNYYDEMWSIYQINKNGYSYCNTINSNQVSFNSKQLLCIYDNWNETNLEGRYKENVKLKSYLFNKTKPNLLGEFIKVIIHRFIFR